MPEDRFKLDISVWHWELTMEPLNLSNNHKAIICLDYWARISVSKAMQNNKKPKGPIGIKYVPRSKWLLHWICVLLFVSSWIVNGNSHYQFVLQKETIISREKKIEEFHKIIKIFYVHNIYNYNYNLFNLSNSKYSEF